MFSDDTIQMELIKLAHGERVLRLTEPLLALTIERKLDAKIPVLRQKEQLMSVFRATLQQAEALAA